MKDLFPKIKKWYAEMTKKKMDYSPKGIKPAHDWRVLFSISLVIVFISAAVAFFLYTEINQDKIFTIADSANENTTEINMPLLKRVTDDLNARDANLLKIKTATSFPKDPSL